MCVCVHQTFPDLPFLSVTMDDKAVEAEGRRGETARPPLELPEALWSVVALFAHDVIALSSACSASRRGVRGVVDVVTPRGTTRRVHVSPVSLHIGTGFLQEQHVVLCLGDGSVDFFFAVMPDGLRLCSLVVNVGEARCYVECALAHLSSIDVVVQQVSLVTLARALDGATRETVLRCLQAAPLRYDKVVMGF